MARSNKYTSINFNHILEKTNNNTSTSNTSINSPNTKPSSLSSYSSITSLNNNHNNNLSTRTHGRMLVLTRPTPKSITTPPLSPLPHQPTQQVPNQTRSEPGSDQISLRPLGRTGTGSPVLSPVLVQERDKESVPVVGSPKPDKFVPPHLRPGFAGREERPGPEVFKGRELNQRQQQQGHIGSPGRHGEDGRPNSGGGYERIMIMGGESDPGLVSRPRSSGNRPSSSGWRMIECQFTEEKFQPAVIFCVFNPNDTIILEVKVFYPK